MSVLALPALPLVTPLWVPGPFELAPPQTFQKDPTIDIETDVIDEVSGFLSDGTDVVWNLGKGVPGEKPPQELMHVNVDELGYSPPGGKPELRELVAGYLNNQYNPNKPITADNVMMTPGNQPGLALVFEVLKSASVFVEAPFYSQFRLPMRLGEHRAFLIHPPRDDDPLVDAVSIGNTLASVGSPIFLTSNPRNPDGAVRFGENLAATYAAVAGAGGVFVSDEAYSAFTMGVSPSEGTSLLSVLKDIDRSRAFVLHTASKNFFAPGSRLGWIVAPQDWIKKLINLSESHTTPPSLLSQAGLLAFLNSKDALRTHQNILQQTYETKRAEFFKLLAGIKDLRLIGDPKGAFFVTVELDTKNLPVMDAYHFSRRLAYEASVSTIPLGYVGTAYKNRLRLSFGASLATIQTAFEKMGQFIEQIKNGQIDLG